MFLFLTALNAKIKTKNKPRWGRTGGIRFMINNHPNTQLLTDYATGGLSMAPLISITTHLQFCDQCREAVSGLNILGGELLTECDEAELSEEDKNEIPDEDTNF